MRFCAAEFTGRARYTFASAVLTAPAPNRNTDAMTIDATLLAGTYYLVGTEDAASTSFPAWWQSVLPYVTTSGSATNGVWYSHVGSGTWTFDGQGPAPNFIVNGGSSAVPEPSCLLLLSAGLLGIAGRRRLFDRVLRPGK
jgi:hypothetical protein